MPEELKQENEDKKENKKEKKTEEFYKQVERLSLIHI